MNKERLEILADHIAKDIGGFEIRHWFTRRRKGKRPAPDPSQCGTAGCYGGHAIMLFAPGLKDEEVDIMREAASLLGLTYRQSRRLFILSQWPCRFRQLWHQIKTPEQASEVAVARLRHFIATGK